MKNSTILATIAMLVLGVITAHTMRSAVATIESPMFAQTISPFDLMQNARGLPVDLNDNAI
jgi:hypothetical protein